MGLVATATERVETSVLRRSIGTGLSRHGLFCGVLVLAVALRATVMLGYRPVMWFNDSFAYVATALSLTPSGARPGGYALFLALLRPFHSFGLVGFLQHAMGLAAGVMIYAIVRRAGGRAVWAVAASLPVLFDPYQVQLEHLIMSDVLFMLFVVASVALVCGRSRPRARWAATAGLLLGLATITRSTGMPLLALLVAFLIIRRTGWRAVTAAIVVGAIPVLLYSSWFHAAHGRFALSDSDGVFLYGRTMAFADCAKTKPPERLRPLCASRPAAQRPLSQMYIWNHSSPLFQLGKNQFTPEVNEPARQFAVQAIRKQPLDYISVVLTDFARSFRWDRQVWPDRNSYQQYEFDRVNEERPPWLVADLVRYDPGYAPTEIVDPYAGFLADYQRHVRLPGTLLAVILLGGLVGLVRRRREWGGAALLPWTMAVALLMIPPATAEFGHRYVLAAAPLACLAAALALARPSPKDEPSLRRPQA